MDDPNEMHHARTPRSTGQQDGSGSSLLGRWLPLSVAGAVALVLIGSALYVRAGITAASAKATHGQGEALARVCRQAWRHRRALPDRAALEAFLAEHRSAGLRYVGLAAPGKHGQVVASAGTALGSSRELGEVINLGDRVRLVNPLRLPRPPGKRLPGRRPPGERPPGERPPGERLQHHPGLPPPPHRPPAKHPPHHGPPGPPSLILEYEPLTARELAQQANAQLAVSSLTAALVMLLALGLSRSLRQREALRGRLERDRRLATLGEMSAVLAHELRNPLASLKGNAQLLMEMLEEGSPRDTATWVVDESVRLERLINDLLAFVRSGELQLAEVSPEEVLRQAADEVGDDRIAVAVDDDATRPWRLDADRMRQALVNVLQNAAQASPPQGRISASVRVTGERLRLIVEDEGEGIPDGELAKIFEPFHTARVRGTGLGLAITKRIVEQHCGTIRAENRRAPDSGARLTISIPGVEEPSRGTHTGS